MPRFRDIPQFTHSGSYMVNVGLDHLIFHYTRYVVEYGLDVNPDFQRGNVWTTEQKIRFMEYMLRGGRSGLDIYINCPTWRTGEFGPEYPEGWMVLVDGKQRLDAALGFLNNEFPVFGAFNRDFEDRPSITLCNFRWHVNDLATREECLQWYLEMNTGGTVHTEEELAKVRGLIAAKTPYIRPTHDVILSSARLDREIVQVVIDKMAKEKANQLAARAEAERRAALPQPVKKARAKRAR